MDERIDIEHADKTPPITHLESGTSEPKTLQNFHYDAEEDETQPRTGMARLYRRNPSVAFMREVAIANTQELDPDEVQKVNRHVPKPRLASGRREDGRVYDLCAAGR